MAETKYKTQWLKFLTIIIFILIPLTEWKISFIKWSSYFNEFKMIF